MKAQQRENVPQGKINEVKELSDLLQNKKTVLAVSIKNLPASQFQEISKKLRGKAIIKFPKKNLIFRAIENVKSENLENIKDYIKDSTAILFSDMDSFELSGELVENKTPAKAKVGQEAPEDIVIPAGPTELMSGPIISDFGALGIPIQIDKGKITVKESKLIVKKGEKISENAANMMSKLDMKPFSIGFIPISAYDTQEKKIFSEININKEEAIEQLKELYGKALAFSVQISYYSQDTIGFILARASMNAQALEKLSPKEEDSEKPEETEKPEEKESSEEGSTDSDKSKEEKAEETSEDKPKEEASEEKAEEKKEAKEESQDNQTSEKNSEEDK